MSRKKSARRMHSEDARFLRDLLLQLIDRINEVESNLGYIQEAFKDDGETEIIVSEQVNS